MIKNNDLFREKNITVSPLRFLLRAIYTISESVKITH